MNHLEDIFKKATVRGIADYLQFGLAPQKETRDYNTRLDEAYDKFEKEVCHHDKDGHMNLLDLANDMENEAGSVYLEVGIQVGVLLAKDMIQNISTETLDMCKEINYQEMYNSLFKDVTCALEILQLSKDDIANKARGILEKGQCRTERIYMESE